MDQARSGHKKGGRPGKTIGEQRREYITVWLTKSEKAALLQSAVACKLQASVFARRTLLEKQVLQAAPHPAFMNALSHFSHLCGNINALSHNIHLARINGSLSDSIARHAGEIEVQMEIVREEVQRVYQAFLAQDISSD